MADLTLRERLDRFAVTMTYENGYPVRAVPWASVLDALAMDAAPALGPTLATETAHAALSDAYEAGRAESDALDLALDARAAARAELERVQASADAWWTEYDSELTAHEATKTERDRVMRAGQAVARGATARIETLTGERDAAEAALAALREVVVNAVVVLNREFYREPRPWIDRLAMDLRALAAAPSETEPGHEDLGGDYLGPDGGVR